VAGREGGRMNRWMEERKEGRRKEREGRKEGMGAPSW
jgi:hypothetical protein